MGRIRVENMTERDVRRFKKEIEGYEKTNKMFFSLGFVAMGLTILFLGLAIMFGVFAAKATAEADINDLLSYEYASTYYALCITCATFASTSFVWMLTMFILRALLFKKKTENRLYYIEEYEIYQKEHAQQQQKEAVVVEPEPLELEAK